MRTTVCVVLFIASFPATAIAQKDSAPSLGESELSALSTYYYLRQNKADVAKILNLLEKEKLLDKHETAIDSQAAFLSIVFSENPDEIDRWVKTDRLTGNLKVAVQRGLWIAGKKDKIQAIFGKTPKFAQSKPPDLKAFPLKQPGDLDMMWGAFMASGDVVYARRVLDLLDETREISGDPQMDAAIRGAAAWSLESFVRQHELVYRLISKEIKTRPDPVSKKLRKMVSRIKIPRMTEHDGDFTAALFIMDQSDLAEFDKPRDKAPIIKAKKSAKVGDIVAIKVVFTGVQLTEDLKAAVDYDIKVLDPENELYDETDLNRQELLHGKYGTRFTIFDNSGIVMLRFEPKDKGGTYTVEVAIHDRIGKKSVSLEEKITLEK